MLLKILMHTADGIIIVTLTKDQVLNLEAELQFRGIALKSEAAVQLIVDMAAEGKVQSVRFTKKTRDEVMEEMRRNFDSIGMIE